MGGVAFRINFPMPVRAEPAPRDSRWSSSVRHNRHQPFDGAQGERKELKARCTLATKCQPPVGKSQSAQRDLCPSACLRTLARLHGAFDIASGFE